MTGTRAQLVSISITADLIKLQNNKKSFCVYNNQNLASAQLKTCMWEITVLETTIPQCKIQDLEKIFI